MSKNNVIVITGGGSWGHRYIIQEVKEHLSDCRVVYVGSKGEDQEMFENDPDFFRTYFFDTHEDREESIFEQIKSYFNYRSFKNECKKIIEELQPKVVFSVGGYPSEPMAYAAKSKDVALVIYEQNALSERINEELRPYAKLFLSPYLNDSPISTYPVKNEYLIKQRVRDEVKCVFFLGSAKGASPITDLALSLAKELHARGIKIIQQTGEEHLDEIRAKYEKIGVDAKLFGYKDKISSYMNEADLAIARAGSSTIWELSANGLPAIYIPYSGAPNNHQFFNAKFLSEQKLAWLMREEAIDKKEILSILDKNLTAISTKLISRTEKNGAEKIASLLKEFL
ncbi:MAG: glycosyltransferase [Campylobacterales bacterium]|nr:glycosyltransferase [Campylobacterales bacterium]